MTKAQLDTYLTQFTLTATDDASEPGEVDVKRKALAHFIRKGATGEFEALGYKQESVSVASNYEENTVTDVLGKTYNDITGKAESIEMSEYIVNPKMTKFLEEAIKLKIADREEEMQDYDILTVYGFLRDSDGKCMATVESGCSVKLDNLGGQGFAHSDVTVTLSGNKKFGSVTDFTDPKFTEYTPS